MSRILIIEDETSIADLERDYLELSGFTVEIENDGKKGLERALQKDIDLLILDLMLPGENGFEICRIVREKKNIPIIMVSAELIALMAPSTWSFGSPSSYRVMSALTTPPQ